MFYYLFTGIILLTTSFLCVNIVKEKIIIKYYSKWNKLNNMVSTKYKNRFFIFWFSIKLLLELIYISMLQYLNKSLVQIDKNNYELKYVINGKLYKNRFKIKRGPKPILQIIDDNLEDVTDIIIPYLGPNYNWHGNKMSPKILGYNSLVFELSDGSEEVYKDYDFISDF